MTGERIDGMDVLTVYEASHKAIELVRSSSTPMLLEIMTYRFRGHSMGDPERYRTQAEVKKWEENDPIGIYRNALLKKKINASELDSLENKAEEDTRLAVEFAEASPEPTMEDLFRDVYADE